MKANILLLCLAFLSCGYDITPPRIVSYTPQDGATVNIHSQIQVIFSESMNTDITQKAFVLLYDEVTTSQISGRFVWGDSNRIMTFIPEKTLSPGYYRLIINKTAADKHGNTLTTQHISRFYAGEDIINPFVSGSIPQDCTQNIPLQSTIIISFSEPMDNQSVEKNIRFSPSFPCTFAWNTNYTICTITPHEPFVFNTWYTVTIPSECTDTAGNNIINQYEFRFKTGSEYIRPQISGIYTTSIPQNMALSPDFSIFEGANINDELILHFSEPIEASTLPGALIINPSAFWQVLWDTSYTSCIIHFLEPLQPSTRYELVINTSLKDKAGNTLLQDRCIYFVTNGILSQYPQIVSLVCNETINGPTVLFPQTKINDLDEELTYLNNTYTFTVTFSMDMLRSSVPDNVKIEFLYGEQPDISGSISKFQWIGSNQLILTISAIEGGNVYKLTFKGGSHGITAQTGLPLQNEIFYLFYFSPQ